jgi:hypothetical protein
VVVAEEDERIQLGPKVSGFSRTTSEPPSAAPRMLPASRRRVIEVLDARSRQRPPRRSPRWSTMPPKRLDGTDHIAVSGPPRVVTPGRRLNLIRSPSRPPSARVDFSA